MSVKQREAYKAAKTAKKAREERERHENNPNRPRDHNELRRRSEREILNFYSPIV